MTDKVDTNPTKLSDGSAQQALLMNILYSGLCNLAFGFWKNSKLGRRSSKCHLELLMVKTTRHGFFLIPVGYHLFIIIITFTT